MKANPEHRAIESPPRSRRVIWIGVGVVSLAIVVLIVYPWGDFMTGHLTASVSRALGAGKLDEADVLLASLLKTHPESAEVHFLAARSALARKQPNEALLQLAQAQKLGYPQPPMDRLVGLIHAGAGDLQAAEPFLKQSWEKSPGPDPEVADVLCRIYFQSFRFRPALEVIERWVKENPDDLRALLWRAEVHTRNVAGPEAQIQDFDAILARDPNQLPSRLGRAFAYRTIGKMDEAKNDYDLYIKARPDDPQGHLGAAKTAEGLDDEDSALSHYEQVLRLDPKNVLALVGLAAIKIRRNDSAAALPLLEQAIAIEPNDPETYYRKGQALDRLGKPDQAKLAYATQDRIRKERQKIEVIRKGLVRDPGNVSLMAEASAWLLERGYDEEGMTWAEKTLAKQSAHPATIRLLVDYYTKKGNAGRANYYRSQLPETPRLP